MEGELASLREEILEKARQYQRKREAAPSKFDPEKPKVPVSGKVVGEEELAMLVDASLDMWLTAGRFAEEFESKLAAAVGRKRALFVNSGSSANLVAVAALTSRFLGGRRLKKGDEVIVPAASFPTTVNPILQSGLVPVFVDIELGTCNIDIDAAENAITEKTRAVVAAHALGNPYDAARLAAICKKRGLFLVEDCCDALGATVAGRGVGTFGDIATLSFYPAHHITTGEGGAVLADDPLLSRACESMRDWGRDCWCKPGCDNTCGKRFAWKFPNLPQGYDHKYVYSNVGYNLKATDMQAAVGLAQLERLQGFVEARRENFEFYLKLFTKHKEHFLLPQTLPGAKPSPFGYLVNLREGAPFSRLEMVSHLEKAGIATRMLFGGNMARQPAYEGEGFKVDGELKNSDHVMNSAFWIGVWPGINEQMRQYVAGKVDGFLSAY